MSDCMTGNNQKLIFIIRSLSGGGAERTAVSLMNALCRDREITCCLLKPRCAEKEYPLDGRVRVVAPAPADKKGRLRNFTAWYRTVRRLKNSGDFRCAVSFLGYGNMVNVLSGHGKGVRTIVSVRNLISAKIRQRSFFGRLSEKIKCLERFADTVVCVSDDVAADQVRNFHVDPDRIRVIRNWVEPEIIRTMAAETPDDASFAEFSSRYRFLFANIGRLDIQKGQWHLIRAFSRLHGQYPDTGLFILGEGEAGFPDRLRDEAVSLDVQDSVTFCGWQKNPFSFLKYAGVYVLASLYEGFPNSVLEAMAAGIPVVSDDCAGIRELLTPEREAGSRADGVIMGQFGIVTPLLDEKWSRGDEDSPAETALYKAMEAMYRSEELRDEYSRMGTARVKDFSRETIVGEWEHLLGEA